MRTLCWMLLIVAAALAGCAEPPSALPASPAAPAPAPADTMEDGAVMARVNGQPIPMARLNDVLVRDYGLAVAQQLVANELVDQEAAKLGVSVTPQDIAAENEAVLARALGEAPPPAQRERMLEDLIARFGVSRPVWDLVMRRQALLRKIVAGQVVVTDEMLRQEFENQYGRQVVVRDIQTATLADAQKALESFRAAGAPATAETAFADLARKVSFGATAREGGLLPPISTASADVPGALRDAALALRTPGQVSQPIQVGTAFHVLYLVSAKDPQNVKIEDVKAKLTESVRQREAIAIQQRTMQQLIQDARRAGRIEFVNPILKTLDAQQQRAAGGALP